MFSENAAGFMMDSEYGELFELGVDAYPAQRVFFLADDEDPLKTDFSGLVEGS